MVRCETPILAKRADTLARRASSALKRLTDLVVSSLALVILSPILLVIAGLVRTRLGSPILFRQRRAGLRGRPFILYKFRTMVDSQDERGRLMPDEARITPLGRVLRRSSLDELPELLHVLSGRMSLVGPRPLPVEYVDRYTAEQARRLEVKPGLTGWAQINGRNNLPWSERFSYDIWYVDNRSFILDVRIMFRTALVLLRREGISREGHATMPEFLGDAELEELTGPPPQEGNQG